MTIELPWPPSGNNYKRLVVIKGKPFWFPTRETTVFKTHVALLCRTHRPGMKMLPKGKRVRFTAHFYPPDRRWRDVDNLQKVLRDSLNGFAYADDKQIKEGHEFFHDEPGVKLTKPGRVVVTVEAM